MFPRLVNTNTQLSSKTLVLSILLLSHPQHVGFCLRLFLHSHKMTAPIYLKTHKCSQKSISFSHRKKSPQTFQKLLKRIGSHDQNTLVTKHRKVSIRNFSFQVGSAIRKDGRLAEDMQSIMSTPCKSVIINKGKDLK